MSCSCSNPQLGTILAMFQTKDWLHRNAGRHRTTGQSIELARGDCGNYGHDDDTWKFGVEIAATLKKVQRM